MKPTINISGEGGNVFAVIGNASKVLNMNDQTKEAAEMKDRAFSCSSYHEVLNVVREYVDFEE